MNILKFIADNSGLTIVEAVEKSYQQGIKEAWNKMCDECLNQHLLQKEDGIMIKSCFKNETKNIDEENWKCCYENCYLLKRELNDNETERKTICTKMGKL